MKIVKKIGGFVMALTLILGVKFYNRSSTAKEVKPSLLAICGNDNSCTNAVDTYFQSCFNSSYDLGGRHRSASFDAQQLASCINNNSGTEYFAAN
jgi:hypothetical protein